MIKNSLPKHLLVRITRFILGSVFVVAGFSKLFPLKSFLQQLIAYRLPLPAKFLFFMALALIVIEIIIGLAVLLNFNLHLGLLGMQILLGLMIPLTIWATIHKAPTCGCYGNLVQRPPWTATIEDLLMLAVSFLLIPNIQNKTESKAIKFSKAAFIIIISLAAFVFGISQLRQILAESLLPLT